MFIVCAMAPNNIEEVILHGTKADGGWLHALSVPLRDGMLAIPQGCHSRYSRSFQQSCGVRNSTELSTQIALICEKALQMHGMASSPPVPLPECRSTPE